VTGNTLGGSDESGVHIDSACGAAANNSVSENTFNAACAGILVGTGARVEHDRNQFLLRHAQYSSYLTADTCTPPVMAPTSL